MHEKEETKCTCVAHASELSSYMTNISTIYTFNATPVHHHVYKLRVSKFMSSHSLAHFNSQFVHIIPSLNYTLHALRCTALHCTSTIEISRHIVLPLPLGSAHSSRETAYSINKTCIWPAQVSALISQFLDRALGHMRRLPIGIHHSSTHPTCWRNSTDRENTYMQ